jgi:hypothetical protein
MNDPDKFTDKLEKYKEIIILNFKNNFSNIDNIENIIQFYSEI